MKNLKTYVVIAITLLPFSIYYLAQSYARMTFLGFIELALLLGFLVIMTEPNIRKSIYSDKLTIPAIGIGVLFNCLIALSLFQQNHDYFIFFHKIGLSLVGVLLGGGSFYLYGLAGDYFFKREAIGGGDIKLVAAIGAFVGPMIIFLLPIWIVVLLISILFYRFIGLTNKQSAPSMIPTVLIHFFALVILFSFQTGVFDYYMVFYGALLLFVWCEYLIFQRHNGGFQL